jgi:hypothetical protein
MKQPNWKHATIAALAASALTCAFAIETPRPDSHGSKGDFTPAQEGRSSNPVPPATVAKSGMTEAGMPASSYAAADRRLADKVIDALNSDRALQGSKITVVASNGDVTLSGTVKTQSQATKAAGIAARKASAGRVNNSLAVG